MKCNQIRYHHTGRTPENQACGCLKSLPYQNDAGSKSIQDGEIMEQTHDRLDREDVDTNPFIMSTRS